MVPKNPPTPPKQSPSLLYESNGSKVFMDVPIRKLFFRNLLPPLFEGLPMFSKRVDGRNTFSGRLPKLRINLNPKMKELPSDWEHNKEKHPAPRGLSAN